MFSGLYIQITKSVLDMVTFLLSANLEIFVCNQTL